MFIFSNIYFFYFSIPFISVSLKLGRVKYIQTKNGAQVALWQPTPCCPLLADIKALKSDHERGRDSNDGCSVPSNERNRFTKLAHCTRRTICANVFDVLRVTFSLVTVCPFTTCRVMSPIDPVCLRKIPVSIAIRFCCLLPVLSRGC